MSLLTVQNLKVYFHSRNGITRAVDGVSFELDKGKTLGIVGESGSGKSVTCLGLLGLLPVPPAKIEDGIADFNGIDLLQAPEQVMREIRGNRIAMVFQDPMTSLNPYMKIGSQITEPLTLHERLSRREARERAIEALAEVGIPDPIKRFDQYPHEFSGGMRQRVMIAMALTTEPDILIADEPTTALDVTIQAQILDLIRKLQDSHDIATIFITHDLGVIAGVADDLLVMHDGKVVDSGTTSDVFYSSNHPYTRKLINSVPTTAKPSSATITSIDKNKPILEINNVSVKYPMSSGSIFNPHDHSLTAVANVTLELFEGEILGLVGESGSGKSSLARSVIRLVDICSGMITLQDKNLSGLTGSELKGIRPQLQMIFQDPYASLNPRMTVSDCLLEALQQNISAGDSNIHDRLISLLDDVELLESDLKKYPHEFSGGQRQRIAIARALALKPKLLLADEPVSALDVTVQAQILQLLLELNLKHNISMIFISHDLSVIRYVSDRTAVMYQGNLIEINTTESLFNLPQHSYTKSLLSAIPVPDPEKEKARQGLNLR